MISKEHAMSASLAVGMVPTETWVVGEIVELECELVPLVCDASEVIREGRSSSHVASRVSL